MSEIQLQGVVQRILFSNPDNGYSVIAVRENTGGGAREVLMVGTLPGVHVQETIKASGAWKSDKKYGLQFAVENFQVEPPKSVAAL